MDSESASVLPALAAACLWAVSAPILNTGLRALPADRLFAIATGLGVSLVAGSLTLLALSGFRIGAASFSPAIVLSGLLTFPVATGLYYVCGHALGARMEIAAQYSNAKPAITILLGVAILGEAARGADAVSVALICLGVGALLYGAARRDAAPIAVMMGLMLAGAWAGGEFLIRIATRSHPAMDATLGALTSSCLIYLCLYGGFVGATGRGRRMIDLLRSRTSAVFILHGVLSFGLAYLFFFHSIASRGLVGTVLITTFWPALALGLGFFLTRRRGEAWPVTPLTLLAFVAFALASLIHIVAGQI